MDKNKQKFTLTIEMLHHGLAVTGARFEHVPLRTVNWVLKGVNPAALYEELTHTGKWAQVR